jgi:NADPH:quinone reductase-like Zn-dependent oxidoreductase
MPLEGKTKARFEQTTDGAQMSRAPWRSLWYVAPGTCELRASPASFATGKDIQVRTLWSAISRGTERLVFNGKVPESEYIRMRAPLQQGDFPFPVKYGYCAAGLVEDGPADLVGKNIFALHPHQDRFAIDRAMINVIPDALPPRRACLAANMETALNALWDSGAGPGDHVLVIGAGVVGLLCAWLAARLPGADVIVCDVDASRRAIVESFGARFATPDDLPLAMARNARDDSDGKEAGADIIIHASATAAGLSTAIAHAGFEARIVELSWYGEGTVPAPLGGAFHSRRLQLVASQVGHVAASRRPRWSYARRMSKALQLLCDDKLDALITDEFEFDDLPQKLPQFFAQGAPGLTAVVRYGGGPQAARSPSPSP